MFKKIIGKWFKKERKKINFTLILFTYQKKKKKRKKERRGGEERNVNVLIAIAIILGIFCWVLTL
jgi:hypothetical protein